MELSEKLQELRKQKGLTQEELAQKLYVSRTAVSKWESGRGYPGIESLRAIARLFSVSVDALLSSDKLLALAERDGAQKAAHTRDLVYGLLDIGMALLLFLPLFAARVGDVILCGSLFTLAAIRTYLKITYFVTVLAVAATGIATLALQHSEAPFWLQSKAKLSLVLGSLAVLLFTLSLQPYAAAFAFALLAIKVLVRIHRP